MAGSSLAALEFQSQGFALSLIAARSLLWLRPHGFVPGKRKENPVKGGSGGAFSRKATLTDFSGGFALHFIGQNQATLTAREEGEWQFFKLGTFSASNKI